MPSIIALLLDRFHCHPNMVGTPANSREIRKTLHREEHSELQEVLDEIGIMPTDEQRMKLARELADVVYISYGTAHRFDIDLDAAVYEVHAAMLRKLDANVRRPEDGKVIKPPGFVPPDMTKAIPNFMALGWRHNADGYSDYNGQD